MATQSDAAPLIPPFSVISGSHSLLICDTGELLAHIGEQLLILVDG